MVDFSPLELSDRPEFGFIQVKDGQVRAMNETVLIQFPVEDVFGPGLIEVDEELYFDLKEWKATKLHTAKFFQRVDNVFTGFSSKKKDVGGIVAKDWTLDKPFPVPTFGFESLNPILKLGVNFDKITAIGKLIGESGLVIALDEKVPSILYVQSYDGGEKPNARAAVAGMTISNSSAVAKSCWGFTDVKNAVDFTVALADESENKPYNESMVHAEKSIQEILDAQQQLINRFGEKDVLTMLYAIIDSENPIIAKRIFGAFNSLSDAMGEEEALKLIESLA